MVFQALEILSYTMNVISVNRYVFRLISKYTTFNHSLRIIFDDVDIINNITGIPRGCPNIRLANY